MAKTIQQLAEENASFVPPRVYGFNNLWLRMEVENACKKTGNEILEEIESLIKTTLGDGEEYHYNLYMGILNLVKQLKGE